MPELVLNLLLYFLYAVTAVIFFRVISCFLTLRNNHIIVKGIVMTAYLVIANTIIYSAELTGTVFTLIGLAAVIFLFYKDRFIVRLSTIIILYPLMVAISFLTEDLGFVIWYYIFKTNISAFGETLISLGVLILRILFWYFVSRFIRSWISEISRSLNLRMWVLIDVISLASFIGIISIIYHVEMLGGYAAYPAAVSCILTCLGSCYLCSYISRTIRADMEIKTLRYQESYYQELEQNQQNLRKLRHDMRNHLNIIHTFLKEQDIGEADSYLSRLTDESDSSVFMYCENNIVNAVLNTKLNTAADLGIKPDIQVEIPKEIPVDDISLCSLIANTLDNAIEACCKIKDTEKRSLSVKARYKNGFFSYEISNTKQNDIHSKKGQILTDKKDRTVHGIGLKNIREIVERYDGTIDISYDENTFTVTAII